MKKIDNIYSKTLESLINTYGNREFNINLKNEIKNFTRDRLFDFIGIADDDKIKSRIGIEIIPEESSFKLIPTNLFTYLLFNDIYSVGISYSEKRITSLAYEGITFLMIKGLPQFSPPEATVNREFNIPTI